MQIKHAEKHFRFMFAIQKLDRRKRTRAKTICSNEIALATVPDGSHFQDHHARVQDYHARVQDHHARVQDYQITPISILGRFNLRDCKPARLLETLKHFPL